MKKCRVCKKECPLDLFSFSPVSKDRYGYICRHCHTESARQYRKRPGILQRMTFLQKRRSEAPHNRARILVKGAEKRAAIKKIEFSLVKEDILPFPTICPLLGIEISMDLGKGQQLNGPSLDRKDPKRGYTKDNVWIISRRANNIKNDASIEELELILNNLKKAMGYETQSSPTTT